MVNLIVKCDKFDRYNVYLNKKKLSLKKAKKDEKYLYFSTTSDMDGEVSLKIKRKTASKIFMFFFNVMVLVGLGEYKDLEKINAKHEGNITLCGSEKILDLTRVNNNFLYL